MHTILKNMKIIILNFIKYSLFWFLAFFIQRNLFLLYFSKSTQITFNEFIKVQFYSFFIDLSTICYSIIPLLLLIITDTFKKIKLKPKIINYYTITLILLSNLILIVDLGLFAEWGIKVNNKAISYLIYPNEVISSIKVAPVYKLLFIFLVLNAVIIILFKKFMINFSYDSIIKFKKLIIFLPLLFISFVGLRGGLQTFPINRSWSYFSEKTLLNQAAVNSTWNFFASIAEKEEFDKNPYNYYDKKKLEKVFSSLTSKMPEKTIQIVDNHRPNIVLILLEGWSAEAIGVLSKDIDATPRFSELSKSGLLFTNFISTGFRTEQALAAITAGFPSQPKTTIIRKFGKFEKLPSFVKDLYNFGYHTSYYYGGDLYFANTEAYLKSAGYKKIIGQEYFKGKEFTEWGVLDHELFDFSLNDLKSNPQPFFAMIMTSTSHEPFTKKVPKIFKGNSIVDDYLNVLNYCDESLYKFIEKSENETWFKNTLFIIVTDHTNRLPKDRKIFDFERHLIPCLFWGNVLKNEYKGKTIDFPVSHIDFAATILAQLGLNHEKYYWSKNIFNLNYKNQWAFYTFDEGFGFIQNNDKIIFDAKLNKLILSSNNKNIDETLSISGKALLQKLLDDYIELSK